MTSGSTRNLCPNFVYRVGQSILPCISCQSDLGISYNNKLKFLSSHINNIVTKASLRDELILKCFQSRDHLLLTKAFCVFVRPSSRVLLCYLESYLQQDITKIEAEQRRFTKRLPGLWNLSYSSRLARISLDSLHCRRIKTDLLMCYKILHNHTCLNPDNFFTRSTIDFTRGNAMKLAKPRVLCDRHRNCFPVRVINSWNSLPDNIVSSSSVMGFKAGVSKLHFCGHCSC